jgi:hypothetical protein
MNHIYLAPYINPLGLEYVFGEENEGAPFVDQVFMTGAVGLRIKGVLNVADKMNLVFATFAEGHTQYVANKEYGIRVGIGLGVVFN